MTKIQRAKLEELAHYVLPVFSLPILQDGDDGRIAVEKYVKLEHAQYLRVLAREILALEKK